MQVGFAKLLAIVVVALMLNSCAFKTIESYARPTDPDRPNIVLIVFEDMGLRIGAFGDPIATTPYLDQLVQQSVRFPNTFTTSGVCAPSRSALITGVHQQTLGTHQMRTKSPIPGMTGGGLIEYEAVPPPEIKAFPELLRRAGYYTSNNGKTDYQFGDPFTIWDKNDPQADWRGRQTGQPFFAMFNILQTHESYIWPEDRESTNPLLNAVTQRNRKELASKKKVTDPANVVVPPYLPDTPVVRADIARHYDNIAFAEQQVTDIIDRLKEDGLLDNTVVIVTTDHGDGFPRMKRTVYDSGIHVPMFVRYPGGSLAGTVDDRLVSFIDLAPTILQWADIERPAWIQGQSIQSEARRDYIFAAADRHDQVPGRTKAVRDARWKYIRNYRPELAVLRPLAFRDALPTMQEIWRLAAAEALSANVSNLLSTPRGEEELYDTQADPHEINNLSENTEHRQTLARLGKAMDDWIAQTGDLSAVPEAQMIENMWPDMTQPITAKPTIILENGKLILRSGTPGASIAYRLDGGDPITGAIYSGPVNVPAGSIIAAKAIRYGYASSPIARKVMPK